MGKWRSRPNGAVSGADRSRSFRKRALAEHRTQSLFDQGEFVAVDGEGFSEGRELVFSVGDGREYRAQQHYYAYLAASDGSELYQPHGRLHTKQCLDFLIDIKRNNPRAIPVIFGGSYDVTHMLHDLSRDEIDLLLHGDGTLANRRHVDVSFGEHDYRLEYRTRKQLQVWRWDKGAAKHEPVRDRWGAPKFDSNGRQQWKLSPCDRVSLWDVWGFFQGTFKGAMCEWLPDDPDYAFIEQMKGDRSIFERAEMPEIRRYNQAELRCLVAIMELLRGALRNIDARISRWDGAGAIAAAMLRQHNIHDAMSEPPPAVRYAALHGYAGGHIEAIKLGVHKGSVFHADVNSAYPEETRHLPNLAAGEWSHHAGVAMEGFSIVRCSWRFQPGMPFYPLYYRQDNGSILYPERGHGWYWLPEFQAAQAFAERFGAIEFNIHECWHFEPYTHEKPFAWVPEIYAERQRIIEEARQRGKPDGRQIAIRLGMNAMYGKLAQQVGAQWDGEQWKLPRYFQLEWAGWITAGCRAKLMMAAMQKPDAIISFATDGIFATEPLDLYAPARKELGAWEVVTHDGMCIVMPGVYWTGASGPASKDRAKHYSRGFDKAAMKDQAFVLAAWRKNQHQVDAPSRRMVTMGSALASDAFWSMKGMFVATTRRLQLDGENSKRHAVSLSQCSPQTRLVPTWPKDLSEDYSMGLHHLMSAPYPVAWLADVAPLAGDAGWHEDREALVLS